MPEVMSVAGFKEFEIWHAKQMGTLHFAEELVAYCESEVKLLKGCLKGLLYFAKRNEAK